MRRRRIVRGFSELKKLGLDGNFSVRESFAESSRIDWQFLEREIPFSAVSARLMEPFVRYFRKNSTGSGARSRNFLDWNDNRVPGQGREIENAVSRLGRLIAAALCVKRISLY